MKNKLLILDHDPEILGSLKELLADDEVTLFLEKDTDAAFACVTVEHPLVALIDMVHPQMSGLEVLREIKKIDPRVCVIMMSNSVTTQQAIEAMKYGAYDYLPKPLDLLQLKTILKKAIQNSALTRAIRIVEGTAPGVADEEEADVMIGSSPEMIEIWKMVGKISDTDATVLLQGESGTGKELLARSIYSNSRRQQKPFLAVNCAALPDTLLESELFGHEKGAFTGAINRHIGKFEQCTGGTIFLDEIAEMSSQNQAKLLRVLENQEFERVGGNETIKVDVRIIAATNQSIINAVREKRFRMDLFYRLKVLTIFLPPLRERAEDIPLLVNFFAKKISRENQKPLTKVSSLAMKLLLSHPWKGNIRELRNVVHSAIVWSKEDTLYPEDFEPLLSANDTGEGDLSDLLTPDGYFLFKSLFEAASLHHAGSVFTGFIGIAEQALFRLTMEKHGNNEVHAAKFLGISRNTLRQRLKSYKLA